MEFTREQLLKCYRDMLTIRRFEEKIDELFAQGLIKGTSHLYAGQEAVAVGVCAAIRPTDYMTSTHRGHGHFLAKGGDPKRIMAELFGKTTGYGGGRGGSQHVACYDIGFLGSNGITGGGIPIATGAGLAQKLQEKDGVVVCFLGEGAANQGTFHESLNMAAIWKLPVIYVCENNQYAMFTPYQQVFAVPHIATRAAGYGMPGAVVVGNDLHIVADAVEEAADRARAGEGPTLLECKTYRYYGHSKSDTRPYRTREEEEHWRDRDPIPRVAAELNGLGLSEQTLAAVQQEVECEIEAAYQFALESPDPDPRTVTDGVYAE